MRAKTRRPGPRARRLGRADDLPGRPTILKAARRCLIRLGHARLSTRVVATEAGVNQSLIHYYFGTKDGLILAEGPPHALGASRYRVAWRAADGTLEERFTDDPTALLATLTAEALARGERLEDLSVTRPSLEDVYLELIEAIA